MRLNPPQRNACVVWAVVLGMLSWNPGPSRAFIVAQIATPSPFCPLRSYTLSVDAHDTDYGTSPGAGIASYSWTIVAPDGQTSWFSGPQITLSNQRWGPNGRRTLDKINSVYEVYVRIESVNPTYTAMTLYRALDATGNCSGCPSIKLLVNTDHAWLRYTPSDGVSKTYGFYAPFWGGGCGLDQIPGCITNIDDNATRLWSVRYRPRVEVCWPIDSEEEQAIGAKLMHDTSFGRQPEFSITAYNCLAWARTVLSNLKVTPTAFDSDPDFCWYCLLPFGRGFTWCFNHCNVYPPVDPATLIAQLDRIALTPGARFYEAYPFIYHYSSLSAGADDAQVAAASSAYDGGPLQVLRTLCARPDSLALLMGVPYLGVSVLPPQHLRRGNVRALCQGLIPDSTMMSGALLSSLDSVQVGLGDGFVVKCPSSAARDTIAIGFASRGQLGGFLVPVVWDGPSTADSVVVSTSVPSSVITQNGVLPASPPPYAGAGVARSEDAVRRGLVVTPNPSRGGCLATIQSSRPELEGEVLDLGGRIVTSMVKMKLPGGFGFVWDGRGRSGQLTVPGVYFVRVKGAGQSFTSRVVLLR